MECYHQYHKYDVELFIRFKYPCDIYRVVQLLRLYSPLVVLYSKLDYICHIDHHMSMLHRPYTTFDMCIGWMSGDQIPLLPMYAYPVCCPCMPTLFVAYVCLPCLLHMYANPVCWRCMPILCVAHVSISCVLPMYVYPVCCPCKHILCVAHVCLSCVLPM